MKNFEYQQFRDELAEKIKEAPKDLRREILEKEKQTQEYWQARKEKISERQDIDKKFDAFVHTYPEQSRKLELPDEFLEVLVPSKIREVASDPTNLEVSRLKDSEGMLSIIVVEHDYSEQLTDKTAWENWKAELERVKKAKKKNDGPSFTFKPKAPEGVNRFHARLFTEVESGRFSLSDRILMTVDLRVASTELATLKVAEYDGEKHLGIASDFYKNTLPDFARKMGFRFITGLNARKNISFFVDTIGRYQYTDIKPKYLEQLFPGTTPGSTGLDLQTVQFLYPEDIEVYVNPI